MPEVEFTFNGTAVVCEDDGCSLLEALRDRLGAHSVKDGCSPQGQCGCCTVWVDGSPRVSCVTPLARVRGRSVTTAEGLDAATATAWGEALCASGGTQCGFCTPGIVMRFEAARRSGAVVLDRAKVDQAMLAHLCRCTGWQTIAEAALAVSSQPPTAPGAAMTGRSIEAAERRALVEGRAPQRVGSDVALGRVPFVDDTAPVGALVAVRSADGEWAVADTLHAARTKAGKVQGRRTTEDTTWPVDLPEGDWARVLQTTWVEPAYLEPDAAWCEPGGEPVSLLANGGAFGGKVDDALGRTARELADLHGRPVRVLSSRADVVRFGPKRPPLGIGLRSDGTGIVRVARTAGIAEAIRSVAPGLEIVEIDVVGPPTSVHLRGAGWAEVQAALASLAVGADAVDSVRSPEGAVASARVDADGSVHVTVSAGEVLDATVLRSYCIGAAHMALGWVRSEAITVDAEGRPLDLTIRSFGALRSIDTPPIVVTIEPGDGPAVNGSDAVFAAVAAAAWRAAGHPARWPLT